jgi:hypothetical protein
MTQNSGSPISVQGAGTAKDVLIPKWYEHCPCEHREHDMYEGQVSQCFEDGCTHPEFVNCQVKPFQKITGMPSREVA